MRAFWFSASAFLAGVRDGVAERWSVSRSAVQRPFTDLGIDARLALRRLLRNPTHALVAVVSLAIGIGFNAVLFTAVNALLLSPLPVPQPEQIVRVFSPAGRETLASTLSLDEVEAIDSEASSLQGATGAARFTAAAEISGYAQVVAGELVLPNYLRVLGISPAVGTGFEDAHGQPGGPRVALLSYELARKTGLPHSQLIGETLRLNRMAFTVVGILPQGFGGLNFATHVDVWMSFAGEEAVGVQIAGEPSSGVLSAVARLSPGVSYQAASLQIDGIVTRLASFEQPSVDGPYFVLPERSGLINPAMPHLVATAATVAIIGCLLVLLVACANVAGLAFAQSVALLGEMRVRTALGASRSRLFQQLLVEGCVLVVPAASLALIPLAFSDRIYTALLPFLVALDVQFTADASVLGWLAASTAVALLVVGVLPALYTIKMHRGSIATGTRGGAARGLTRMMRTLVLVEVSFAVVVLVLGSLFLQTLRWYGSVDLGFETRDRTAVTVDVGFHDLTEAQGRQFFRELEAGAALVADARGVGLTGGIGSGSPIEVHPADGREPLFAERELVGPGYFETLRIAVVQGRPFTTQDEEAPPVVVVNRALVAELWPDGAAVGRRLSMNDPMETATVVGVVSDTRTGFVLNPKPRVYAPLSQHYRERVTLIVESSTDPAVVAAAVSRVVQDVEPGLPIVSAGDFDEIVSADRHLARAAAIIGLSIGLSALFLSAVGIFGMVAFTVQRQRGELGVRLALGATPMHVFWRVVGGGLRIGGLAAAIGLPPAIGLGFLMQDLAIGSRPLDPALWSAVLILLFLVVSLAVVVPAARAATLDPSIAITGR